MPFRYPDLVSSAKPDYIGMRARKPGRYNARHKARRKYSWNAIGRACGRSAGGVRAWMAQYDTRDENHKTYKTKLSEKHIQSPMPLYMSAWMQLLDNGGGLQGTHPKYVLSRRRYARSAIEAPEEAFAEAGWPSISHTASFEDVEDMLLENHVGVLECEEAFCFPHADEEPTRRYYTVKTLGNDGVSLLMLQLMLDVHPQWKLISKDALQRETKQAVEAALDFTEQIDDE